MKNQTPLSITGMISVDGAFSPDNGEDAATTGIQNQKGVIACLDGCGGSGAQRYSRYSGWTGARLASHFLGRTIFDWFISGTDAEAWDLDDTGELTADKLHCLFDSMLGELQLSSENSQVPVLKGKLVKLFPTTLSMVLIHSQQKNVRDTFLWAGDSRGYLFSKEGLIQMTDDDVQGALDPNQNLIADGVLSNVIQAGGDYVVHARSILVDQPHMVITATDGCFAYFHSPIEMEYLLLRTLAQVKTPNEWARLLEKSFRAITSDDFTMRIAIIGFQTFRQVKAAFVLRYKQFVVEYGQPLERMIRESDQEGMESLWSRYKKHYSFGELD